MLNLTRWLDEDVIDLAVCEQYLAGDHSWQLIGEDEMGIAMHRSLPIARKKQITLEMLNDYHVIYPSLLTQNAVAQKLREQGIVFDRQTQFYTEDGSASLSMVELTKGITFLTRLYEPECPDNVVIKSLPPPIQRRMGVAVNWRREVTKPLRTLISCMKKTAFAP